MCDRVTDALFTPRGPKGVLQAVQEASSLDARRAAADHPSRPDVVAALFRDLGQGPAVPTLQAADGVGEPLDPGLRLGRQPNLLMELRDETPRLQPRCAARVPIATRPLVSHNLFHAHDTSGEGGWPSSSLARSARPRSAKRVSQLSASKRRSAKSDAPRPTMASNSTAQWSACASARRTTRAPTGVRVTSTPCCQSAASATA